MAKKQITGKDKKEAGDLELRSEELRDILGQVPRWIVRFGTMVILVVLLFLFLGSAFLRYPDIIKAPVTLTTETPPAEIVANTSARISKIFVKDKDLVVENQILAVFESASKFDDIIDLDEILARNEIVDSLLETEFPENMELGTLQESYALMQKRLNEYSEFIKLDYYKRKINSVTSELKKYSLFLDRLEEKEEIQKKDYELTVKQYRRDSILFTDQVISSSQLERSEAQKLSKLSEWKSTQTERASSQIEISNLQQEILELELKSEENSRDYEQEIRESVDMLKGKIALWKQEFLIRSPFIGQVSFTKIWSENQYVEKGEAVLTVLPSMEGEFVGKVMLSAKGAGKIEEGHKVVIRFDNYPYLEFGTVTGKISSISLAPTEGLYAAEIRLDSTRLVTNYTIDLTFQQNMPGIAEIITNQRSLLARIVDPFRSAIMRQRLLRHQ